MERMISIQDLEIGMYVSKLDRPWLDTPFLIQGHLIKDRSDIDELKNYCRYVFIDIERGDAAERYLNDTPGPVEEDVIDFLEKGQRQVVYENEKSVVEECPAAEIALNIATDQIADLMENVRRGKNLDISKIRETVQPLLDSMVRNVDALLWTLKIQGNEESYQQALEKSALGIAVGKHLGLHLVDIKTLAIGMLLLDVGKYKIPAHILNKPGPLTREEFAEARKHVEYGIEMLDKIGGVSDAVISMVRTHHERFDGSGYPAGLGADEVPLFGVIAAIIDTYCTMCRKTPYRDAIAPHKVLQELYKWRDRYFHAGLIEQFLQCVGVYPTGSLVEMTTGEVAIVIAQNSHERLEPTLCMLLDEQKNTWQGTPVIDLSKNRLDARGVERKIKRALKSGAYGIASWETAISR
jgi:HD-GYP domain-containing protein (c-di-GMP phosphodiesterase class II)